MSIITLNNKRLGFPVFNLFFPSIAFHLVLLFWFLCSIEILYCSSKPTTVAMATPVAKNAKDPSTKLDGKVKLHVPPLNELASNLENILRKNFQYVNVTVEDCPDLTLAPFSLAASGISGSPKIIDVGGPGNLYPVIKKVLYDLREVCKTAGSPNCLALGPAAGPLPLIGFNTEFVHNTHLKTVPAEKSVFKSYMIYTKQPTSQSPKPYEVKQVTNETANKFLLMANLFISDGKPGKVLKIRANKRTGQENFVTCMRLGLAEKYGTNPVGLGGVFLTKSGRLKMHVMPEIPDEPFKSKDEIDQWLKYFDMDSPMTCTSVFVSHDPGLDLRVEHTHCFSDHGDGGHYHYDISPDEIEYEAYYTPAEYLYRIDQVPF